MSQLALKPALKRPRAQRYLSSTAMAATASTMALVSQVLGFEIIEVWTKEDDGKLHCTYVHVDDEILEQYPDIIHGHFPKHKKEHVLSPMLCRMAEQSKNHYHWRVVENPDIIDAGGMSDKAAADKLAFPMKTEISYKLDGRLLTHGIESEGEDQGDAGHTYIVAFSLDKIEFKPVKLKFLKGLAIAIVVAAYELEEEEENAGGHADATTNGELDEKEHVPAHHLNTFSQDVSANSGSHNAGHLSTVGSSTNLAGGIASMSMVEEEEEAEEHGELEVPAELTFADNMEHSTHLPETMATPAVVDESPAVVSPVAVSAANVADVSPAKASTAENVVTSPTSDDNKKAEKKKQKKAVKKAAAAAAKKQQKKLNQDSSDEEDSDEATSASDEEDSSEESSDDDEDEDGDDVTEKNVSERRMLTRISPSSPNASNHVCTVPTWSPSSWFSYPIADIPVKYTLPSDLTLESFRDVKHIADGSNSNVYIGKYGHTKVIIKMIKEEVEHDEIAIQEFDLEYGTLARLNHPNIIGVIGAGFEPRRFIVLEHLGGGSLNTMLNKNQDKEGNGNGESGASKLTNKLFRKPSFTYANLLQNARLMAEGLDYLHRTCHPGACFIHRDLKPDNVGFTKGGQLKLFDFGLVTCVKSRSTVNQAYEMTGYTGSLRYMAPEVVMRKPYTEKADVYSFGIMLWQMARDKVPFKGFTKDEFIEHVVELRERPKCDKSWPVGFTKLINACWDHDQHKRPTFQVIVAEINKLIAAEVGDSLLAPTKPKKVGIFG